MKIKKLFVSGLICLSLITFALADGDTPGGNRQGCQNQPDPITSPVEYLYWFVNC